MTEPMPLPHRRCPLCGGDNGCVPAACGSFETACWCRDVVIAAEVLARVPDGERLRSCLCRQCAAGAARPGSES